MAARSLLLEGRGKKVFEDGKPDQVLLEFKEYIIDSKSNKRKTIKGKGSINASVTANLFEYLNSYNVSNHFVAKENENEIRVKKLEIIPIEILIRNFSHGKFCKKYGIREGEELKSPVMECHLKNEKLKKPLMCESLIYALDLAKKEEVMVINQLATKTNAILKDYFARRGLKLIEIRLEFGRLNGSIILADEISLDTCSLLDTQTNEKYYQEDMVLSDLPAGWYDIQIDIDSYEGRIQLEIFPGQVTYFTFQGEEGFTFDLPPSPGIEALTPTAED